MVRLSAPLLTRSFAPAFTGRIEVDITAEDLPAGDTRLRATLGKHCLILCETQQILTDLQYDLLSYVIADNIAFSLSLSLYCPFHGCSVTMPALKYFAHTLAGSDYIVNLQDFTSTNFTVTFLSKQANSTEHVIIIADDRILEGREHFRLRLSAIRPIGQAADFYVPQAGFENTFVGISIEDDDSKSGSSFCANCRIWKYLNVVTITSQEVSLYSCTGQLDNITSHISD